MKVYFARHGQTDANIQAISASGLDQPLNDVGRAQAVALGEELKDVAFDAIVSSPLLRSRETADTVNVYHTLPITLDAVWRERETGAYLDTATWNDLFDFDKNIQAEDTETLDAFFKRIYGALDDLSDQYKDETILIVSHGGVHHALYAYVNKLPLKGNVRIDSMRNCEYRIYDIN
jgi:broad specificity phosphatase PhoE